LRPWRDKFHARARYFVGHRHTPLSFPDRKADERGGLQLVMLKEGL
jgi:hypothetical protein